MGDNTSECPTCLRHTLWHETDACSSRAPGHKMSWAASPFLWSTGLEWPNSAVRSARAVLIGASHGRRSRVSQRRDRVSGVGDARRRVPRARARQVGPDVGGRVRRGHRGGARSGPRQARAPRGNTRLVAREHRRVPCMWATVDGRRTLSVSMYGPEAVRPTITKDLPTYDESLKTSNANLARRPAILFPGVARKASYFVSPRDKGDADPHPPSGLRREHQRLRLDPGGGAEGGRGRGTLMDVGCRMSGCRMSDAGCRMPDVGCRMSDVGCRMSDVG